MKHIALDVESGCEEDKEGCLKPVHGLMAKEGFIFCVRTQESVFILYWNAI